MALLLERQGHEAIGSWLSRMRCGARVTEQTASSSADALICLSSLPEGERLFSHLGSISHASHDIRGCTSLKNQPCKTSGRRSEASASTRQPGA